MSELWITGLPKESVVPVYVKVLPPEMRLPRFSEPFYTYTVSEDVPIGTEIDLIRAEHSGTVLYSLVKGNTPESNRDEFFVIDKQSGRLKLERAWTTRRLNGTSFLYLPGALMMTTRWWLR